MRGLVQRTLIILAMFAMISTAQSTQANSTQVPRRIALVIGISAYEHLPVLANPKNDATLIATTLRSVGFETTLSLNSRRSVMVDAVRTFVNQLRPGDIGLFYYAGHAVQVRGRNYFLPVEVVLPQETDLPQVAFNAEELINKLAGRRNATNIIILDACRNSPYPEASRSVVGAVGKPGIVVTPGLAQMDAPKGTLIAFSTAPGKVALDGRGTNSIYTATLATQLQTPGLPIEEIFKRVRVAVTTETSDRQIPWENTSLTGTLVFVPSALAPIPMIARTAPSDVAVRPEPLRSVGAVSVEGAIGEARWNDAYLASLWTQRGKPTASQWQAMAREIDSRAGSLQVEDMTAVLRAAEAGNTELQMVLAEVYVHSGVVPHNIAAGLMWLDQAAQGGSAIAMHRLGLRYLKGDGVAVDQVRGRHLLQSAVASGYASALADMGRSYRDHGAGSAERAKGSRYLEQANQALTKQFGNEGKLIEK